MNDTFYKILPSGIKIVHRMSTSPVVYTGIMAGAGTRDERSEENGMAHYIEHCVFKGCLHRTAQALRPLSARQIINRIEGIGGEINAYTTKEETTFYAAAPRQCYRRTLELIADMVFRPTFPKEETEKELGVILDEIESYNDSPSELIYDDFEGLVFEGNTLALPILGSRKTLRAISRKPETAQAWIRRHYSPARMVVFSQGAIPFAEVVRTVESILGEAAMESTPAPPPRITPTQGTPHTLTYRKHTHQAHIMLGGRAYEIGHKNQLGMYLLNNILGGGSLSSRLNLNLREKKGWVYTVESQYTPLSDTGYWNIYFACEPGNKERCLEQCLRETERLRNESLSSAQLQRALKQLRGQMAVAAENQENNVLAMAKQMLYHDHAPTWQEVFAKVEQTSPRQLQDIAREVLGENNQWQLLYE